MKSLGYKTPARRKIDASLRGFIHDCNTVTNRHDATTTMPNSVIAIETND